MIRHKSAVKRNRQSIRRKKQNKSPMSELKTMLKKVRSVKTLEEGEPVLKRTTALLDKYAAKGLIHKNNAANKKRKLTLFVNSLGKGRKSSS
jgi:small subunit ribosomal protein S20